MKREKTAVNMRVRSDYLEAWKKEADKLDLNLSQWVTLQCQGSGLISRLEKKIDEVLDAISRSRKAGKS